MNWTAIGTVAEVVAAVAVVVSLVYLAAQIRQSTKSVRAATEMEAASHWSQLHSRVAHSPDMSRIWDVGHTDPDQLTAQEQQRFIWFVCEYFFLVEGLYRQYDHGFLSESSWTAHETTLLGLLQNDLLMRWWKSGVSPFSRDFVAHVNRAASLDRGDGWSYSKLAEL